MLNQEEKDVDDDVKTIEISGKTVDEAIEQGLAELATTREQVDIEVLREGRRGVFGLGSEDALVRLSLKQETVEPPPAEAGEEEVSLDESVTDPAAQLAADVEDAADSGVEEEPAPVSDDPQPDDVEQIAVEYLEGLLKGMGIEADVATRSGSDLVDPGETPPLVLDITGSDLGILIGRRSETLRALQYMLRLMVSKRLSRWHPITIDVESYRVRRRRSLHQLATKMAERAVSSRRQVVMEAMPAYERRIIHIVLRDNPTVYTKSVGSDDNRKVTIIPK